LRTQLLYQTQTKSIPPIDFSSDPCNFAPSLDRPWFLRDNPSLIFLLDVGIYGDFTYVGCNDLTINFYSTVKVYTKDDRRLLFSETKC
jgi:hypothetical protein